MGLIIWNWRDGTRRTLKGVEADINNIHFSPDGQYIAAGVGGGSGGVLIWNVCTGQLVEKLMRDVDEWVHSIAFTPDGMGLVSATSNGVRLWDISLLGMDGSVSQLRNGMMVDSKELLNFGADEVRRFCLFRYLHKPSFLLFFLAWSLLCCHLVQQPLGGHLPNKPWSTNLEYSQCWAALWVKTAHLLFQLVRSFWFQPCPWLFSAWRWEESGFALEI